MGTTVQQDFTALDRLTEAYEQSPREWERSMTDAMYDTVAQVDKEMTQYPMAEHWTRAEVYGTPFKTERQRRWFFAALSSGELVVPYPRTGELRERWLSQVNAEGGRITGRNWNDSPYVQYVQDKERQARLIAYWQTLQDVVERIRADLESIFVKAQEDFISRVFAGE